MNCCSIEGCDGRRYSRGWCRAHYDRWVREHPGELRPRLPSGTKLAWLLANYAAPADGPCILWPFQADKDGYGQQIIVAGRSVRPHAYATELRDGPPPSGMQANHGPCNDRLCVIHTYWGTQAQNYADMLRDGTSTRGERNGSARLSESDVLEIRRRLTNGEQQTRIARSFNVSVSAIHLIAKRRNWAWLP